MRRSTNHKTDEDAQNFPGRVIKLRNGLILRRAENPGYGIGHVVELATEDWPDGIRFQVQLKAA